MIYHKATLTTTHKNHKNQIPIKKYGNVFLLGLIVFIKCVIMTGKHSLLYKIKDNNKHR